MAKVEIQESVDREYSINEAFKRLRTNIEFCGEEVKVITLTSCTPNEGKSNIAVYLAASIAETGKKVLLIDADLRKSILIGMLKVSGKMKGLTYYLSGQCRLEEVICSTDMGSLDICFAGPVPPNPAELLGGEKFRKLIEQSKQTYDYVIIDTPPLGSVIDSAIVAKESDGVAIVVEAEMISYKYVRDIQRQLEKTNCRILGVILNKVRRQTTGYYSRKYLKYSKHYKGSYLYNGAYDKCYEKSDTNEKKEK